MTHSIQSNAFRADKNLFFNQQRLSTETSENKFYTIDGRAQNISYSFMLDNQKLIEAEFKQLFAVLQNQKDDENKEAFWFYCYYNASLLEAFHDAYSQTDKVEKYKKIKNEIKERLLENGKQNPEKVKGFIDSIYSQFIKDINGLAETPFHVSKIRNQIGFINMMRIDWIFNRLIITQGLLVARDLNLIEQLDLLLGTHTNVDNIIAGLQIPTGVINYFSVGLFLGRFMINAGMLIQHTFFQSEAELESTTWERFKYELDKRHWGFINDIAWASVNFLTNFSEITHVTGPLGSYFTAAFLTFDVAMLFYQLHLDKQDFLYKKSQYRQEIKEYSDENNHKELTEVERLIHLDMLNNQLLELENNWKISEATLYFLIGAASLLASGFTASLIVCNPILVVGCYLIGLVGVAAYLSKDVYSQYIEKSLALENDEGRDLALKEFEMARNEFIYSMTKNAMVPLVMITTIAICWPAAVVLATVYLGYETCHAYTRYVDSNTVKQLALAEETHYEVDEVGADLTPA